MVFRTVGEEGDFLKEVSLFPHTPQLPSRTFAKGKGILSIHKRDPRKKRDVLSGEIIKY